MSVVSRLERLERKVESLVGLGRVSGEGRSRVRAERVKVGVDEGRRGELDGSVLDERRGWNVEEGCDQL
jgi:hypothetical protein